MSVPVKSVLTNILELLSQVNSDHENPTDPRFRLHNLPIAAMNRAKRLAPASWE
jgi:hypothetical protein